MVPVLAAGAARLEGFFFELPFIVFGILSLIAAVVYRFVPETVTGKARQPRNQRPGPDASEQ